MSDLKIFSTSRSSADVSDIPLRETSVTRLVFRPTIVDNPHDSNASVRGSFVFQRKGPKEAWQDIPVAPLTSLKKGEGFRLELKSAELLTLYASLSDLYRLHAEQGIPLGETEYVKVEGAVRSIEHLSDDELRTFLDANSKAGTNLICRLLAWVSTSESVSELVEMLEAIGPRALRSLNAAVNLGAIREALSVWDSKEHRKNEEFWQSFLAERSFLLEQAFYWPCTIVSGKAYVGGKSVENRGGHIVDFLLKNGMTQSAALVEIKTPAASLTGANYREGIPSISSELAGSVVQVLSYKASLAETYLSLGRSGTDFEVFDPPCVVVIGCVSSLDSSDQRRSFELFRRQLVGVSTITFDELFERLRSLLELLESPAASQIADDYDEECPF